MDAENLFIHNGGNWQTVEAVSESLPKLDVVTTLTLTNVTTKGHVAKI